MHRSSFKFLFLAFFCTDACLNADLFMYEISNVNSDPKAPTSPWAIISFEDKSPDVVEMTINVDKSIESLSISKLNFNFNSQADLLKSLSIKSTSEYDPSLSKVYLSNAYNEGSKETNFQIIFPASIPLAGGSSTTFEITGKEIKAGLFTPSLDVLTDPFLVALTKETSMSETNFGEKGDIALPEPATYSLLAALLGIIALKNARRRRKT